MWGESLFSEGIKKRVQKMLPSSTAGFSRRRALSWGWCEWGKGAGRSRGKAEMLCGLHGSHAEVWGSHGPQSCPACGVRARPSNQHVCKSLAGAISERRDDQIDLEICVSF